MKKIIFLTLLTIGYFFTVNKFFKLYLADVYANMSGAYLSNGEFSKAVDYSSRAIKNNPEEPSYYRVKAKVLLANLILQDEREQKETKKEVLNDLIKAQSLNGKNLATLRNSIPLYYFLAVKDLEQPVTENNLDQDYLPVTQNYYQDLKVKYPNDLGLLTDLADYEKKLFLLQDYQETVNMVETLRPDVLQWHPAFN